VVFLSTDAPFRANDSAMRSVPVIPARVEPLPLAAERIVLRRLRPTDLADFQSYRADPEVGRFQGWSPVPSSMAQVFLADMNVVKFAAVDVWFQLGIADRATDRLIGDIGFSICGPGHQHAELGFTLSRPAQGRGLATEAVRAMIELLFEHTEVARVVSIVHVENHACVRLLQRLGMRLVGTVDSVFRGEPCVEYVYMIWRKQPARPRN
jgi:RimJ/RimL family protein N-acetyltransferase